MIVVINILTACLLVSIGFVLAAIMIIGRQSDPREPEDREYSLGMEDKIVAIEDKPTETARIFTEGRLVKWKEDTMNNQIFEIIHLEKDKDGQTVADIANGIIGFTVPIEELEEV